MLIARFVDTVDFYRDVLQHLKIVRPCTRPDDVMFVMNS